MARFEGINRAYQPGEEPPTPEERQEKLDKLMKDFLSKGGKVETLAPGAAQGAGGLDRTPHWTDAELKAKWRLENNIPDPEKKKGRKKKKSK